MLLALSNIGTRISPSPGAGGLCPCCGASLIAKCGKINIWHWSHHTEHECEYGLGETEWHRSFKSCANLSDVEVKLGTMYADVKNKRYIVELQNSFISPDEINLKETFFVDHCSSLQMIWLFNCLDAKIIFRKNIGITYTFRWKWPRKTLMFCKMPIFLHVLDENKEEKIFYCKKLHDDILKEKGKKVGGWGYMLKKEQFVKAYLK